MRGATPEPSKPGEATGMQVSETYGKLPLSFEANAGQTDAKVKFLSRGSGYSLFLTDSEAVLTLTKNSKSTALAAKNAASSPKPNTQSAVVRMKLVGANPRTSVAGRDELPGNVNYFIGNDPTKWRTNVPTYAKVDFKDVYPGIDLTYYGHQRRLEYDFVVAPGADPSAIRMRIAGAQNILVDDDGQLIVQTKAGELRWNKPVIYQGVGAEWHAVNGRYVLRGQKIGFRVAAYDTSKPLVIDPTLVYSTYVGGSGDDAAYGIAVDAAGNVYVTGQTSSTNFPITTGAYQTSFAGRSDIFVIKLDAAGTTLLYSTYMGGSSDEVGTGIALDSTGNAYVAGTTYSANFPTTAGAFQTTFSGGFFDGFVTKLDPNGSNLVYSTYLGGSDFDEAKGIAVDVAGDAYVVGYSFSTDFPTTPGAFQTAANSGNNVFVSKLDPTGTNLVYSTYIGGTGYDDGRAIAVDAAGNAYVTGLTGSTDFPTTLGAYQTTFGGGNYDVFMSKLNAVATSLDYSTYLGGTGNDQGHSIAIDGSGNACVAGETYSTNFPVTAGAFQTTPGGNGDADAFAARLNSTGTTLLYSTYLGGALYDAAFGVVVDNSGNTLVTGWTDTRNPGGFPTT
ncbi:MAG: hypothetical protein DME33_00055, partial [Verrucomicrobia bacterium]